VLQRQVLTTTVRGGRSLPPLQTAAGAKPLWQAAVWGYFCKCWIRLFIFVKLKKKI
jgi:hypothetical protein